MVKIKKIFSENKVISIIGIIQLFFVFFLIFSSFEKKCYDHNKNCIDCNSESVYATVDGIGIEYFIKERFIYHTSPALFFYLVLLLLSLMFLFYLSQTSFIDNIKLFLILLPVPIIIFLLINNYFININPQINDETIFLSSIISPIIGWSFVVLCLFIKKGLQINLFKIFVISFLFYLIGVSIYISQLTSVIAGIHEGNFAQIDMLGIAIYDINKVDHLFSTGYIVFKLLILVNIIFCLLLISSELNKSGKK